MRRWLAIFVAVVLASGQVKASSCSIDPLLPSGAGTTPTTYSPTVTSRTTAAISTSGNSFLVLHAAFVAETDSSFSFPQITSITPLSWSLRERQTATMTDCYSGTITCYVDEEVWTTLAPSPLSSQSFTITANSDLSYANFVMGSILGSSGFDPNVSLPAVASNITTSPSTIQVTGVSTTNASDLIMSFCVASIPFTDEGCEISGSPSGWSTIGQIAQQNIFIGFGDNSGFAVNQVSSPQSGVTVSPPFFVSTSIHWIEIVDAIKCGGVIPPSSAFPQVEIRE